MKDIHIGEADFQKLVIESKIPVLVDFYADWCGPCKRMSPVIEALAGEYEGKASVFKIDADGCGDLAADLGISSIPALLFFKDGKEAERFIGMRNIETLRKTLDGLL